MSITERENAIYKEVDKILGEKKLQCIFPKGTLSFMEVLTGLLGPSSYRDTYQSILSLGHQPGEAIVLESIKKERFSRYLPEVIHTFRNEATKSILALHLAVLNEMSGRPIFMGKNNPSYSLNQFLSYVDSSPSNADSLKRVNSLKEAYISPLLLTGIKADDDALITAETLNTLGDEHRWIFENKFLSYHQNSAIGNGYGESAQHNMTYLKNIARVLGQHALVSLQDEIAIWVFAEDAFGDKDNAAARLQELSTQLGFNAIVIKLSSRLESKALCKELTLAAKLIRDGKQGGDWLFLDCNKDKYSDVIEREFSEKVDITSLEVLCKAACGFDYVNKGDYSRFFEIFMDIVSIYMNENTNPAIKPFLLTIVEKITPKCMAVPSEFAKYLTASRLDTQVEDVVTFFEQHDVGVKSNLAFVTTWVQCLLVRGYYARVKGWVTPSNADKIVLDLELFNEETTPLDVNNANDVLDFIMLVNTVKESAFFSTLGVKAFDRYIKNANPSKVIVMTAVFIKTLGYEHADKLMRKQFIFKVMMTMCDVKVLLSHTKGAVREKVLVEMLA